MHQEQQQQHSIRGVLGGNLRVQLPELALLPAGSSCSSSSSGRTKQTTAAGSWRMQL
jgi:hypothetical protein